MTNCELPHLWRSIPIREICSPIETTAPEKRGDGYFLYVDISSINNQQKVITNVKQVDNSEAPSRARQVIKTADVLVSTVRPNLNAVVIIPADLDGEICSTGFCVLRARQELIYPEYLFAWVRHPAFIEFLIRLARGIGYPAVRNQDIQDTYIPFPPLPEQRQIVDILQQADELRHLRQQAHEKTQQLLPAIFDDMFGDPISNPKGFAITSIGDILIRNSGIITGPFGSQLKINEFVADGIAVYGIENVLENRFVLNSSKFISNDKFKQLERYSLQKSDVLLTRMGTVGRACIINVEIPKSIISYHLFRLRTQIKRCLPDFLAAAFNYCPSVGNQLKNYAVGAIMSGLNSSTIRSIKIPLPPIHLQEKFVNIVNEHNKNIIQQEESTNQLNSLFESLLSQAFSGELTAVWREQHREEILQAAAERDTLLGKVKPTQIETIIEQKMDNSERDFLEKVKTAHFLRELSQKQQHLYKQILKEESYFTTERLCEKYSLSLEETRRALHILAALGLIIPVTLPVETTSGKVRYLLAYRQLKSEDDIKLSDRTLLKGVTG